MGHPVFSSRRFQDGRLDAGWGARTRCCSDPESWCLARILFEIRRVVGCARSVGTDPSRSQLPAPTSAGPCDRFLLAADSQAFTPFRTPPFQHKAAVLGTHSYEKPMSFLAPASIGLKCPLSLHCERFWSNTRPSMVANAFLRCQLARLCVRVGGFRESSPRRSRACAFGCSPKFSTPGEKTVEIRQVWN